MDITQFIIPYTISNIVAISMLFLSWKLPKVARLLYFLLFFWASFQNSYSAINEPHVYLNYADFALLDIYKNFILGFFSTYITIIVLTVAICQLVIAFTLLTKGTILKIGTIGGILFFISIAPLGVGAACPSSIIWAVGLYILYKKNLDWFKLKYPENKN